jgi:membrane fusion protein (multidrug efflux system)
MEGNGMISLRVVSWRPIPIQGFAGAILLAAAVIGASPLVAQDAPAPKVSVMAAKEKPIRDSETFIGRGEAIDKVDLVARVSGYLEEVLVEDGAEVSEGDLLFRIESSTYEATLETARAEVAKAEANLELAGLDLDRKQELFERGAVPEAERDTSRANELVAEAALRAAQASVKQAELNLSYTEIKAPFSGRAGRVNVSLGEVIAPGGKSLINLVREAPIYVTFSLNEKSYIDVLEKIGAHTDDKADDADLPDVFVILPNHTELAEKGQIAFVDNRIDPATGSVAIRAQFDNDHRLILDGSFLTVGLKAQETKNHITISQAAIQRDQQGPFVLVVEDSNLVTQRYIVTGDVMGTEIIVLDGLTEGQKVVVEGLQRIRPGVEVSPVLVEKREEN